MQDWCQVSICLLSYARVVIKTSFFAWWRSFLRFLKVLNNRFYWNIFRISWSPICYPSLHIHQESQHNCYWPAEEEIFDRPDQSKVQKLYGFFLHFTALKRTEKAYWRRTGQSDRSVITFFWTRSKSWCIVCTMRSTLLSRCILDVFRVFEWIIVRKVIRDYEFSLEEVVGRVVMFWAILIQHPVWLQNSDYRLLAFWFCPYWVDHFLKVSTTWLNSG